MNKPPRITLSMIVKNEEKYLRECLESVKGIADEIIIVDTGSTDNTINIAGEFGAVVYNYEWINNFSAARNYALSKSTGDWILYLDADERLSNSSAGELKKIVRQNDLTGCRCLVSSLNDVTGKPNYMRYARLFRNNPNIKFTGAVHEQIDDSLRENGYKIIDADIEIIHVGYNVSNGELKKKALRNLSILKEEYKKSKSAYNMFQLANTYSILQEFESANKYYLMSVENGALSGEYKAHAYLNLSDCEFKKHNLDGALKYLNEGLQSDASNVLLNLLAADIFFRLNKKNESLEYCRKAFAENKKISSGKSKSALAVGVNPEAILFKGIYYSLLVRDEDKLNYFLNELQNENRDHAILFIKLINGQMFSSADKEKIVKALSTDNIDTFLFLIEKYRDKQTALEILKSARSSFSGSSKFLKSLGVLYSENNLNAEAKNSLEESLSLEEKDPASVFYLISVLIQNNQTDKIPDLLLFAEKEFGRIPEFNSNFEILKQKLSVLFKN